MAARRKCVICNEPIVDEDGVPYKGRYAHKKCFNIAIKTLQKDKTEQIDKVATKKKVGRKARPQAELKEALSEEEYAVGFKLGDDELTAKVDKALQELNDEKKIEELSIKYFAEDITTLGK